MPTIDYHHLLDQKILPRRGRWQRAALTEGYSPQECWFAAYALAGREIPLHRLRRSPSPLGGGTGQHERPAKILPRPGRWRRAALTEGVFAANAAQAVISPPSTTNSAPVM